MTVNEYRKKHKKCLYCIHCDENKQLFNLFDLLKDNSSMYFCNAKLKYINIKKGKFCKLFRLKEFNENG